MSIRHWDTFTLDQWDSFTLDQWDTFTLNDPYDPLDYFIEATAIFIPFQKGGVFDPVIQRLAFRPGAEKTGHHV